MVERPANAPGTRQRICRDLFEIGSVFCAALDVGFNSFDMQLDNCILPFVAEEELEALFAIHES